MELQHSKFNLCMQEALKAVSQFLQVNGYGDTLKTLRSELLQSIPQQPSLQLLKAIENVSLAAEMPDQKHSERPHKVPRSIASRLYSQEQADALMESLMTRVANNPNLLNDSNLNRRIQNIMDNRVFLKLVENTEVFQEEQSQASESGYGQQQSQSDLFRDQLELVVPPPAVLSKPSKPMESQISFIEAGSGGGDESMVSRPEFAGNQAEGDPEGYVSGDFDYGYDTYEFRNKNLKQGIKELSLRHGYPQAAIKRSLPNVVYPDPRKRITRLPSTVSFPDSKDDTYPLDFNGVLFDCMKLKVIYNRERTGYEQNKDYPIIIGEVIAGRFQIIETLGSGAFASVMKVLDLLHQGSKPRFSCLKMITNVKQHFDQALDEIRILQYVNNNCDPDGSHLLRYHSCFYHKQHLFIETELLGMNLLDLMKKSRNFFSMGRLQTLARTLLEGVARLNKMYVMHCDLKLENVLVKSLDPFEVKIADLGNSNFVHDRMNNYMQSRSYRAPEVILGLEPTIKIDVWSIGCIIGQLWIGRIFFQGPHLQGQLANIQRLVGPWPQWMLEQGTLVDHYFLPEHLLFKQVENSDLCQIMVPRASSLESRLRVDDKYFVDFLRQLDFFNNRTLLEIDPTIRPDAQAALRHPFLTEARYL